MRRIPEEKPVDIIHLQPHHHPHLLAQVISILKERQSLLCLSFFIFKKIKFLKSSHSLFLIAICISIFGCSRQTNKKNAPYTDYDHGAYLYHQNKLDSAFLMFNRYLNNQDDLLNKAKAYSYMGDIQWVIGDLYSAQESLTAALSILDPVNEKHREEIGLVYNLLGNVSLDLNLPDEAINFYDHAKLFLTDEDYYAEAMNGKAMALQKKGDYSHAKMVFDSIALGKIEYQGLSARIIDNRAVTNWLLQPSYPALTELHTALRIRLDSQYTQGANASYAHLSEYFEKEKPDSALWYANKMMEQATANRNPEDILEAIDKLIRFSSSPATIKDLHTSFKKINDSLQFSQDTTRSRFALIRYDVQNTRTKYLKSQADVATQRFWILALIVLAISAITWLRYRYNKRRKRMKQEADDAIRESKLKTSRKVHDVVANGLYVIMNELEHGSSIDKEPLMTKIEGLYERSRNISYEDDPAQLHTQGYDSRIQELLTGFASEQTKVIAVGNEPVFWNKINAAQKHELELVLKELMVNMKKHSQATHVALVFRQENNKAFITYTDDGKGLKADAHFGNGLKNTVSRIKSLHGDIIFGKSDKEGLSIEMSFPLQPYTI
jgi:tetratricopeptide (TPR) repeat protein